MTMPFSQQCPLLSDQGWIRYQCYSFWKLIIFNCRFPTKVSEKKITEWNIINLEERQYLPHYWSDKGYRGLLSLS